MFWHEYKPLNPALLTWNREGYGVSGYATVNNIKHKVCERVNGNAKREATCFKEYKNPTKYKHSVNIEVPIPEQWNFNQDKILTEINNLKEQTDVPSIFISE